jgi:predicted ribosome quality control (RQC) complex YloA/Tae2 family protein
MNMSLEDLTAIAGELVRVLPPKRLSKVSQPEEDLFMLQFYGRGEKKILLISTAENLSRVHLAGRREGSGRLPSPFLMLLRKHLEGRRLSKLFQVPGERAMALCFEKTVLLWTLAGRRAFLALFTAEGLLLGASRKGSSAVFPEMPEDESGTAPGPETPFSPSRAAEDSYRVLSLEERFLKYREKLLVFVDRLLKKTVRKKTRQEESLNESLEAESLLLKGNLILSHLSEIGPRSGLLQAEGQTVELAPNLSPSENAQAYFLRYRKKKEGRRILEKRLEETGRELSRLKSLREKITASSSSPELDPIAAELEPLGLVLPGRVRPESRPKKEPGGLRRFSLPDGNEILVGKNGAQNDYLTFRLASPDDLWFHARAAPGAHVLLRLKNQGKPAEKSILAAAQLAAYFSRSKNSAKVEVACTRARYVRQARPHRPGLVVLEREKTYLVFPAIPEEVRLI